MPPLPESPLFRVRLQAEARARSPVNDCNSVIQDWHRSQKLSCQKAEISPRKGHWPKNPMEMKMRLGLGHRLISAQPDAGCGEFDKGEEVGVMFLISGGDGPVMLEL